MNNEIRSLKLIYFLFLIGLALAVFISWQWNYKRIKSFEVEFAKIEASASYNKDLLYRRWASMHGGVYVPVSEHTPPNPNLLYVNDRDLKASNGKTYTLVNPAYMTRQVHQIAEEQYGVKGHITSLNPIRALNKADDWENRALLFFEKGNNEFSSTDTINGKRYLRYMKAMITEKNCLKCHAQQGYKLGDIRGGISVTVPLDKYEIVSRLQINRATISHLIAFGLIVCLSLWGYFRLLIEMKKRNEIQARLILNESVLQKQNQELLKAKIRAEESDKLKTAFIQNISHEIRTPMNSIIGFSELIENPTLTEDKRHRFVNIIISSTKQLLSIVNNILTISALDKKQEVIETEPVNVNHLLDDLFIFFKQKTDKKGITLTQKTTRTDHESEIITDKTKLTQVISNLLSNAVKFTEKGSVEFGYNLSKGHLEFYVKDTGIGIIKEQQELIFERFRQANLSIGKKFGGSGLGLSISKGFVEMLGGKIWVESQPGVGSTFRFTIPYKK